MVIGVYVSRPQGALPFAAPRESVDELLAVESGSALEASAPALLCGNIRSPNSTQDPITRTVRAESHMVIVRDAAREFPAREPLLPAGPDDLCSFMLFSMVAASLAQKTGPGSMARKS